MLDKLKEFEKIVKSSEEFKSWKLTHEKAYLCSAFLIGVDSKKNNWQIDFYNPLTDKITSFFMVNELINSREDTIFKKPDDKINELDVDKININLNQALQKFEGFKKKKYPNENPTQKIIILQNIKQIVWNITYINTSFNVLNIKIDAINGKIIEHNLASVMSFKDKKYDKDALNKLKTKSNSP